jgi:hypothetical protein
MLLLVRAVLQTVPLTEQRTVPAFGPGTSTGTVTCSIRGAAGDSVEATVFCCTLGHGGGGYSSYDTHDPAQPAPTPPLPDYSKPYKQHSKHNARAHAAAAGGQGDAEGLEAAGDTAVAMQRAVHAPQQQDAPLPQQEQERHTARRAVRAQVASATTKPEWQAAVEGAGALMAQLAGAKRAPDAGAFEASRSAVHAQAGL